MPATSFQKCSICNTSFHKHQSDLHTYHILFMFKSQYFMRETLQKIGFSKIFCIKKCINIMYQWTLTNKLCLPLRYVILTTSTQKAFSIVFILSDKINILSVDSTEFPFLMDNRTAININSLIICFTIRLYFCRHIYYR